MKNRIIEIISLTIAVLAAILIGASLFILAGVLVLDEKYHYMKRRVERWFLKKT